MRPTSAGACVILLSSLLLVALPPDPAALAAIAVLALGAAAGVRLVVLALVAPTLTVGARSVRHREVLTEAAAPRHPNTAGRPRTRAPAGRIATT